MVGFGFELVVFWLFVCCLVGAWVGFRCLVGFLFGVVWWVVCYLVLMMCLCVGCYWGTGCWLGLVFGMSIGG